ncbi:uncharacterized protein LOC128213890 isoform X24 [Mya arenaria]|uniref:uncharacterized protein LOC128213890 isoform X24 n=1 Tax=Mya arenaria TaxID=6604 RepID=UPI0022E94A87|nr:uncharacterized protein LOC128213890 isoform X24 [Mya arenaria]
MWNAMKYNYNVREAYRFHFDEPPAAPLTHEETRRVRQIMDWDKHQADVSPRARNKQTKMSERTGLEHYMTSDIIRKDAPFGTTDTPCITMKIIGGRQVPVIEKHATFDPEYLGSRIQPLRPIADKPNHVDPRVHGDNPGAYYNRDVQKSLIREDHPLDHEGFDYGKYFEERGDSPTAGVNKRPDSKDVVRAAQYRTLPPIQQNRTRNDMSTVFEAEPWTDNRAPQLADETEYKQNYFLGGSETMDQRYENPGYKEHHLVPDSELSNLRMLVPRNVLLPVDPIRLTRDQEVVLCKLICNELPRFDSRKLRDVYLECSQLDKGLSGFCDPYTLKTSLERHNAFLPESLSIIGAQFVDPNYPGRVNYEKVLSFIGSALDLNTKGQLEKGLTPRRQEKEREYEYEEKPRESPHRSQSNERPKYYMENGETFKTGSIYRDREVAKLLQMITTELSKSNYKMDWTSWQNAFFEKDRDRRDTLSAAQIKDICYDHKLPLSDSLLNQILSLCEDSNRDGQYKWHEFLEFMRRVRPSLTGLPIPHRNSSPRRDISPRREPPSHRKGQDDSGYVPSWQQRTERGDYEPRDRNRDMPRRNERVASLLQRAPSRYERPKSYAEPQREIGSYNIPNQETRHRSLSPVRQASPGRQQSPYRQATPRLPSPSKEPTVASYPQAYRDNYINDGKDDGGFDREIPSYPIHNPPYMQQTQQTSLGNQQYQSYGGPQPHVEQQGVVRQDQSYSRPKYQTYQPYIPSFSNQQSQQQPQQQQQQIPQSPTFEDQNVSQYRLQYVSPVTQARQAYDLVEQNKPRYGDSRRDDPYYRGGGGDTNRSNREQQINQLSHQLRDLEAKYEVTRDGMESKEKPWLERYLKLAQALYNSDISNKGCLPRQDVIEIVEQYNNAFNLNLDMNRANMMAISPDVLDKSGNILLRPFLANLSRR